MIRRIEIDKHGNVCLQIGRQHAWYDISGFPPRELDPLDDRHIPMSALARGRGLDVLAYRPARRLVAAGREGGTDIVWKGYRRGKVSRSAANYRLAAEALHGSEIRVPDLIEVDSESDFIAMRHETGHRPRISADFAAVFHIMGKGTRALQSFRQNPGDLDEFGRDQELAVLDERIRRLALAGGSPPEGWPALHRALLEVSSVPTAEPVVAHRDLHDGQWLVEDDRPCLVDFDLLCRAEPELDAGNFLAHLDLRRMQQPNAVSEDAVNVCGEAFLDGLGCGHTSGQRARLAFYRATTFARLALVYQLRPKWSGLVGELVARGQASLAELGAR